MNFEKVLKIILEQFRKENINYGLIGGFALGLWGIVRATADLDFLIDAKDLEKVSKIMEKLEFKCVHKTKNVSQYVSTIKQFGEIDFIHAWRKYSLGMLSRTAERLIFQGKMKIRILIPEDIIGMKIQAFCNDSARQIQEMLDIEKILDMYSKKIDWQRLKEIFYRLIKMESSKKNKQFKKYKSKNLNPDEFIRFLQFFNSFIDHRPKRFKKIKDIKFFL